MADDRAEPLTDGGLETALRGGPSRLAAAAAAALALATLAAAAALSVTLEVTSPGRLVAVFASLGIVAGLGALLGLTIAGLAPPASARPPSAIGARRAAGDRQIENADADAVAALLDGLPMAAGLIDRHGRIQAANAALRRLAEHPRGARSRPPAGLTGARLEDVFGADAPPRPAGGEPTRPLPEHRLTVGEEIARLGRGNRIILVEEARADGPEAARSHQEQKMQAVGRLAGGVAHDLNNVMTAIIGWCDLLLRQHQPSDASFRHIISIKQSANRAAALVKQLLAFSSRQTLQPTALRLNDVIAELAIMLDRLRGGDVALEIDHGRDLWPVMADHGQIEQVITNLVVNARDAMKGRGNLTIRTRNVPAAEVPAIDAKAKLVDSVLIEVADTGPGIPEDVIDRIFDPFFSTKPFGEGTGLGLATVYGIVQQTGGSIGVESAPAMGTRFRILLPRLVAGAADAAGAAGAADATGADGESAVTATVPAGGEETDRKGGASPCADLTGSGAILLVEDDEAIRLLSAKALSNQGYTVYTASSGEAALALMQQRAAEIDLLITDVLMPEMDGPTLAAEVRAIRPDIRLVLMSGYAETPIDRERLGQYLFLSKPFDLKQLAAKAKEALERTPAAAA